MQTIQLSDDLFETLAKQAAAAGFDDPVAYLKTLTEDAAFDPRCSMSDDELRRNASECNAINERMKEKGGHDAREAFTALGKKFGFNTPA